jgi:hypothetical protein
LVPAFSIWEVPVVKEEEQEPQVFVVRFWPQAGVAGGWRGRIEHVPSGKRSPIQDLAELQSFIQQRLQDAEHRNEQGGPANR